MTYEINKKYPKNKLTEITEWWQTHREFDVNEYEDYVEIVKRSDELIVSTYREERVALLNAFDKYKINVQYGIEQETEREKETIVQWYKDLLNLKSEAFIDVPEKIKYYI